MRSGVHPSDTNSELRAYIDGHRADVDARLMSSLPVCPDCPAVLHEAMGYSLSAGGKRLRPILCLAAVDAVAARDGVADPSAMRELAMPAACALELIHTYSLIHDDLPAMDNDTLRRGRPTLHVVAGEGMAILAGDGLLTEAFALLAREPRTSDPVLVDRKLRVMELIASAAGASGMVGGQAMDITTTADGTAASQALVAEMHAKKTGALINAAILTGAIMAGADETTCVAMGECGRNFGLAFQIVDDLLDVEGSRDQLGKTPGKDQAVNKLTYPALFGVAASRCLASECIDRAHASLRAVGLADTRLLDLGRWILARAN